MTYMYASYNGTTCNYTYKDKDRQTDRQTDRHTHSLLQFKLNNIFTSEFLITFEAWAKLTQKWLVCAPLRIHLEPIN